MSNSDSISSIIFRTATNSFHFLHILRTRGTTSTTHWNFPPALDCISCWIALIVSSRQIPALTLLLMSYSISSSFSCSSQISVTLIFRRNNWITVTSNTYSRRSSKALEELNEIYPNLFTALIESIDINLYSIFIRHFDDIFAQRFFGSFSCQSHSCQILLQFRTYSRTKKQT